MSKPASSHNSDGGSSTVLSATLELSASSSQVSGGSETSAVVFSFAPYWAFSSTWHCKHPDSSNEQSYIQMSGPYTSDEVTCMRPPLSFLLSKQSQLRSSVPPLQVHVMYKNRQMKGSNLVVGLSSSDVKCEDIPPSFLRTLSYVFEVAKAGGTYRPVTPEDIISKLPAPVWCRPLWHRIPHQNFLPASHSNGVRCSSDSGRYGATDWPSDGVVPRITHLFSSRRHNVPYATIAVSSEPKARPQQA